MESLINAIKYCSKKWDTKKLKSCKDARADQGDVLVEFFGTNGSAGYHPSRGGPVSFRYIQDQRHLNILYNVAKLKSNQTLTNIMLVHPVLKNIPTKD